MAVIICNAPDVKPGEHITRSAQYAALKKILDGKEVPLLIYGDFRGDLHLE